MIVTTVDVAFELFRAHTPQWASAPLSGAGAAKQGGRLNRPGVNALYLAASDVTAIAEYKQDCALIPPLTLASYRAELASVVDFRDGYVPGLWDPLWQELNCNWRRLIMLDGVDPPSWSLSDMVLSAGHCGVLFPSTRSTGTNLVVYMDALGSKDSLVVHDPNYSLPKDRSSWVR